MVDFHKCAIVGCGFVGSAIAYTYAQSGLFSEMALVDINRKKAEGEALDIAQGLPFLSPMKIYAGEYSDVKDAALIVIAAGANQKVGETRLELLSRNIKIFDTIIEEIIKYNSEAILLVVTNPVDILTYYTLKASGFPPNRVIGSGTVLDTARLKQMIGKELLVDSRNIHAFILGEHGDSELPVWSSANVSGIDLRDFYAICGHSYNAEDLNSMFEEVRDSAYKIIEGKGATYYAIAQAVMRITESIVRDEDSVLPVSAYLTGQYGINDVCLGVPSIVGKEGIRKILEIPLNREERKRLVESASVLRSEFEGILTSFC
jgi:L-lactate dehydrogenase